MKSIQAILFVFLFSSCNSFSGGQYKYQQPGQLDDGVEAGSLLDQNIDTTLVSVAINRIERGKYGEVHSILIYKSEKLVLEEYFEGHDYKWDAPRHYGELWQWHRDSVHAAHSVSKSVTSICVGIAVDQGIIKSVDQSIFEYLPEYEYLNTEEKKYITIEHLLTGTSGLQWAEWSAPLSSMENDQIGIYFYEKGPLDFVLRRPMVAAPGTHFTYSGGNIETLGEIIKNASGMGFDEYGSKYLFEPLGITEAYWGLFFNTGEVHAAGGLMIRPRDMIKIGVMMLNDGVWKGERILSSEWVDKSRYPFPASQDIDVPGEDLPNLGYSYAWWTQRFTVNGKSYDWYSANGWGGQKIIVLPELESVVVLTGANYTSKVKEWAIMEDYILPALINE